MPAEQPLSEPRVKAGRLFADGLACAVFLALLFLYYRNHSMFLEGMRALF